jgi:predicted acyltransferase
MTNPIAQDQSSSRLISLDVLRGIIMVLLCAESCRVYESIKHYNPSVPISGLIDQFFHHPWHGLHFWDLVQPAFMFMAGAAMYISYSRKLQKGITWTGNIRHILIRSFRLFAFGVALHCVYAGKPVWELWNVLTQLSFTTLVAYLIINKSYTFQIVFSVALLILTEFLYRTVLMPGFNQPFVEGHNFGSYVDTLLMGKINSDGWVTINCIPTAAHTIWGVLAGKLLISTNNNSLKIKALIVAGILALLLGYGMDVFNITPIIKRISTSSFALASGGWVLLLLALVYWFVDIQQNKKYAWIATVMGMNAIFIYVFFETLGMQWLNDVVNIFSGQLLHLYLGFTAGAAAVVSALLTLYLEWRLCYWLFKRGIFFKL